MIKENPILSSRFEVTLDGTQQVSHLTEYISKVDIRDTVVVLSFYVSKESMPYVYDRKIMECVRTITVEQLDQYGEVACTLVYKIGDTVRPVHGSAMVLDYDLEKIAEISYTFNAYRHE